MTADYRQFDGYLPDDERLSAYLDGELSAPEQLQLEERLTHDAQLRQLVDELRAVRQQLESLPEYKLSGDFAAGVLRRTQQELLLTNPQSRLDGPPPGLQITPSPAITQALESPSTPSKPVPLSQPREITDAKSPLATPSRPAHWRRPVVWLVVASAACLMILISNSDRPRDQNPKIVVLRQEEALGPAGDKSRENKPQDLSAPFSAGGLAGKEQSQEESGHDTPFMNSPALPGHQSQFHGAKDSTTYSQADGAGPLAKGTSAPETKNGPLADEKALQANGAGLPAYGTGLPTDYLPRVAPASTNEKLPQQDQPAYSRGAANSPNKSAPPPLKFSENPQEFAEKFNKPAEPSQNAGEDADLFKFQALRKLPALPTPDRHSPTPPSPPTDAAPPRGNTLPKSDHQSIPLQKNAAAPLAETAEPVASSFVGRAGDGAPPGNSDPGNATDQPVTALMANSALVDQLSTSKLAFRETAAEEIVILRLSRVGEGLPGPQPNENFTRLLAQNHVSLFNLEDQIKQNPPVLQRADPGSSFIEGKPSREKEMAMPEEAAKTEKSAHYPESTTPPQPGLALVPSEQVLRQLDIAADLERAEVYLLEIEPQQFDQLIRDLQPEKSPFVDLRVSARTTRSLLPLPGPSGDETGTSSSYGAASTDNAPIDRNTSNSVPELSAATTSPASDPLPATALAETTNAPAIATAPAISTAPGAAMIPSPADIPAPTVEMPAAAAPAPAPPEDASFTGQSEQLPPTAAVPSAAVLSPAQPAPAAANPGVSIGEKKSPSDFGGSLPGQPQQQGLAVRLLPFSAGATANFAGDKATNATADIPLQNSEPSTGHNWKLGSWEAIWQNLTGTKPLPANRPQIAQAGRARTAELRSALPQDNHPPVPPANVQAVERDREHDNPAPPIPDHSVKEKGTAAAPSPVSSRVKVVVIIESQPPLLAAPPAP
ncbi:MAG: hypothetical protein SFX18_07870 [Pirellulales bacterium]|nr:hypothetical protein [Pirellulales bacterium]